MIRFRPLLGPTLWFLPALAVLLGLGVWQVQRLHWKEDLIQRVQMRMHEPAVPLGVVLSESSPEDDNLEWRRVIVRGRFRHDRELYLFARGPRGETGVQVITPFAWETNGIVFVNRGFVPDARRDPATRAAGQTPGEVDVRGVIRDSAGAGLFTPSPDLRRREWYSKNADSMAAAAGVSLVVPFFIEADATPNPGGYPIGGQTVVEFPNNHLQYAITWFLLALALLGVYLVYHARQGRLRWQ